MITGLYGVSQLCGERSNNMLVTRIKISLEIGDDNGGKFFERESLELYRIVSFNVAKRMYDKIVNLLTVSSEIVEEVKEEIYVSDESSSHVQTETGNEQG